MKLDLLCGSVVFLIAGISLLGNSLEVNAQSELEEAKNILGATGNATANATSELMSQAENVLNLTSDTASNATRTAMSKTMDLLTNATSSVSDTTLASDATSNATSQSQEGLTKYENPVMGIKFDHPNYMLPVDLSGLGGGGGCESGFCYLTIAPNATNDDSFFITLNVHNPKYPSGKGPCDCSTLMNYVRWDYGKGDEEETFVNDNQTMINKNHTAWQMETTKQDVGKLEQNLKVWTVIENVGYTFGYHSYEEGAYARNLPVFRQILDSVTFMPPTPVKKPSFLNSNETTNSSILPSTDTAQDNSFKILSSNDFIDSIGYLHVVGEVENNTPTVAQFVKVTGTFYDTNNQVVATDFTYTNPSDIGSGQKAPFELTLTSASIPVSQIDHYNLIASYQ